MKAAVEWVAEGGMLPEFLNRLHAVGIAVGGVRRQGESVRAVTSAADYKRLREAARRTGTRVRIHRKRGWGFRVEKWKKRRGIAVGAVLAGWLLWQLSGRIWAVIPSGIDPAQSGEILSAVAKMGVDIGQPIDRLQQREITLRAIHDLRQVIALTVNMDGCIAHVDVVEDNTNHPLSVDIKLSNLVAVRDGLVLQTEITKGKAAVQSGEGVTAGDLLATGSSETIRGMLIYGRAAGAVWARTKRELTVEVPLSQTVWLPSGQPLTYATVSLLGLEIPLTSPLQRPEAYRQQVDSDRLTVGELPLPLGIDRTVLTPLAATTRRLTPAEAKQQAEETLAAKEAVELRDATIEKRELSSVCEDGVFRITARYICIENIAEERPVTVVEGS